MHYLLKKISKNKLLVLILNIWCFLLNAIILLKKEKISTIIFRNIDNFIINISSNPYSNISSFLNNKFKNQKKISINEQKEIRYYIIGFDKNNYSYFLNWRLGKQFNFKYDENNPDYLIYSVKGNNYLNPKWNNCIKIAYFGENCVVNFEQADYGMGNHHITYLDRYFRIPLFPRILNNILYKYNTIDFFDIIRQRVLKNKLKTKFCAAVISNNRTTDHFRLNFIEKLNLYKKVDMGGKYHNSFGGISVKDKIKFLSSYKFSIAMENTNGDGYISEKIIDSFLAGTIPIYYGDYMLDEYINPKTYILIKGIQDLDKKIEYIKKIDKNAKLYKEFLKEKVILDKSFVEQFYKEYDEFLINIFKQEKNLAKRK